MCFELLLTKYILEESFVLKTAAFWKLFKLEDIYPWQSLLLKMLHYLE